MIVCLPYTLSYETLSPEPFAKHPKATPLNPAGAKDLFGGVQIRCLAGIRLWGLGFRDQGLGGFRRV